MPYSKKDLTGHDLSGCQDMNGLTISGSCFSQHQPDTPSLPAGLTGATFISCNLDNVLIPAGNTLIGCTARRFLTQNDGNDWEVDENNAPVRLLNYVVLDKMGIAQPTPADLPADLLPYCVDYTDPARNVRS